MPYNHKVVNITNTLVHELFCKEAHRLQKRLQRIIDANHELGRPDTGFLFRGEFHTNIEDKRKIPASSKQLLHMNLTDMAEAYLADRNKIETQRQFLSQSVHSILRPCKTDQDVRDMLPDSAIVLLPEYSHLDRTRPEGWYFRDMSLHWITYEKLFKLLRHYLASRMTL